MSIDLRLAFFVKMWIGFGMAEKSLNDLPRDLRVLHTKGHEAFQRDNFDYAIDRGAYCVHAGRQMLRSQFKSEWHIGRHGVMIALSMHG